MSFMEHLSSFLSSIFMFFLSKDTLKDSDMGGSWQRSFIVLSDCKVGGGPEMIPQTDPNR
jgi:hypothetical protein